jgi:putative alpha-1,2-mannosidase
MFIRMLDSVFVMPPIYDESYYRSVIHEIREMQIMNMGQYAHGNQPIQHMLYLYNYAGQPWKTQYWVRESMNRLYKPTPDGYCGDEDNGQTSAWYIFLQWDFTRFVPICIWCAVVQENDHPLGKWKQTNIDASENSERNLYVGQSVLE